MQYQITVTANSYLNVFFEDREKAKGNVVSFTIANVVCTQSIENYTWDTNHTIRIINCYFSIREIETRYENIVKAKNEEVIILHICESN